MPINTFNQSGLYLLKQFSVGNWYQNLLFYILITTLISLNFYLIKRKDKLRKLPFLPHLEDKELFQILSLSASAIAVYATEKLVIEYANEVMLNYWNKDHKVIGKTVDEELSELKNKPILDLLESVWTSGGTLKNKDAAHVVVVDGVPQTLYLNSEYRAIKDAAGTMLYILQTTVNVTENYLSRKALTYDNDRLAANIITAKEMLIATGEELELSYANADRLSTMLLETLDCFSAKIDLADIGYWSVNLQTQELNLSNNGRILHGVPEGVKLTLEDGLKMLDPEDKNEITQAIELAIKSGVSCIKECKINPLDGSRSKRVKISGNILYDDLGIPSTLSGSFVLINS